LLAELSLLERLRGLDFQFQGVFLGLLLEQESFALNRLLIVEHVFLFGFGLVVLASFGRDFVLILEIERRGLVALRTRFRVVELSVHRLFFVFLLLLLFFVEDDFLLDLRLLVGHQLQGLVGLLGGQVVYFVLYVLEVHAAVYYFLDGVD